MVEAFRFAIKQVNRNNGSFLYGYRFEVNKYYDVSSVTTNMLGDIIKESFLYDVPFLVGPYSSETSYVAGILSGIFHETVITYGAEYIDFPETAGSKSFILRTAQSNRYRMQAIFDIVKTFGWNYVSIISSFGYDGERDTRFFTQELPNLKVCLGNVYNLPRSPNKYYYKEALRKIAEDDRGKVLLLFTNSEDSKNLLKAVSSLQLVGRFQLFCVFGCTNYDEVVENVEHAAHGMLNLDVHNYVDPDFERYFATLNPIEDTRKYFLNFWQGHFNCSLELNSSLTDRPLCTGRERFKDVSFLRNVPSHTIIHAVFALACAVRTLILRLCKPVHYSSNEDCSLNAATDINKYSSKIFEYLWNSTNPDRTINLLEAFQRANYSGSGFGDFHKISKEVRYDIHIYGQFNTSKFQNIFIGQWRVEREKTFVQFRKQIYGVPKMELVEDAKYLLRNLTGISCSLPCPDGFYNVPDPNFAKVSCCWSCSKCPALHISMNGTCIKCAHTERVVNNKCVLLERRYIGFQNNIPVVVFTILSVVGFLSVTFTTSVFGRFNNHRLSRASGRDLFYVMLFGILLTFVCPFTMLSKPSRPICVFRGILPGFAFLTCYAPLFLKTNRIYRIFLHAKTSVTPPNMISPQSQLFILAGITAIQLLLSSVWFVSNSADPQLFVAPDRSHTLLKCKGDASPVLMLLSLTMSVMFMLCCTVLAFKTRHFPKNYNEAKDIGVTLYITCVVWSVFLPAYFMVTPWRVEFIREYLMSGVSILVGYISLFGLFGRKLKILLSTNEESTDRSSLADGSRSYNIISRLKGSTSGEHMSKDSQPTNSISFRIISQKNSNTGENNNGCVDGHLTCDKSLTVGSTTTISPEISSA